MSASYGTTKYASNKQEKRVARAFEGRVVIASGALFEKGDVITDDILFECKTTKKAKYPFKVVTWLKIFEEARKIGKCPVVYIDLKDFAYSYRQTGIVVLRRDDFDYYNIKSCLGIQISSRKTFNTQITLGCCDSHTAIFSTLIGEELVVLNSELFCAMVKE